MLITTDKDARQQIIHDLKHQKCALLCGAGISFNSGLPLAIPLLKDLSELILENSTLSFSKQDLSNLLISIPFEVYFQSLSLAVDIESILRVYDIGLPNSNHFLIARLYLEKKINTLITTNFDGLIENAYSQFLDSPGFIRKAYTDEQLNSDALFDAEQRFIKIHGCIQHSGSIQATISSIAKPDSILSRKRALEYTFAGGDHECVIIIGYSLSDIYDVVPIIKDIEITKRVYLLEHSNESFAESITENDVFSDCTGLQLHCNIDGFIEEIWNKVFPGKFASYRGVTNKADWSQLLKVSINEQFKSPPHAMIAIGLLLERVSRLDLSIICYEASIERLALTSDLSFSALTFLGSALRRAGKSKAALECYLAAFAHPRNKPGLDRIQLCNNIGNLYKDLGMLNLALKFLTGAASDFELNGLHEEAANSWTGLGHIYKRKDEIEKSSECYNFALNFFRIAGNYEGTANSLLNLAYVLLAQGDIDDAIKRAEEARIMFTNLMLQSSVVSAGITIGACYLAKDDPLSAKATFLRYMDDTSSRDGTYSQLCYNLGITEFELGNNDNAMRYLEEANRAWPRNQHPEEYAKMLEYYASKLSSLSLHQKAMEVYAQALHVRNKALKYSTLIV